jgi:glycosyltransferase involved in cell wall biosynthesis
MGVPKNKINLIYYAIDSDRFKFNKAARTSIRSQHDIKDSDIVITYVARLTKKVPTKLWSAKALLQVLKNIGRQNVVVLFIGGGDGVDELRSLVNVYKLENQVVFAGSQPHENIPEFLSASDYFWFVMKDPLPTYGLALQEAMSCGCAVITNNSGSMREIVENEVNGYLIEPDEESMIQRVSQILQQNNAKQISNVAVQDIRSKYSWAEIMPRLQEVIVRATDQKNR